MAAIADHHHRDNPAAHRGWWWAGLALAIAWFVYAIPWLFHGLVIPWDAKDFYYPILRFLADSLAQGEPGQWNPDLYSGMPAIADPQSWYFTPTFRLFAMVMAAPSMTAMDAVELLHLLAGAIGLLLLCRRLGLHPVAAVLAGLVFMFGGVASSRLQHSLMIVSYAYLPWALLLLTIACESPARRVRLMAAAGFGLVAGVMAVDRDQVAFLNCLFLLAMAGWQVARRLWPRPEAGLRLALELTPALICGALVLGIPMLLTLDLLAISTRPEIDFTTAAHASLQPAALLTLFDPDFYRALQPSGYWGPGELPWMSLSPTGYDWTDIAVNHFYIGIVPLALLGCGFAIVKARNAYHGFFIASFVVSLLYTIGAHTPVFHLIYHWVPGVDLYRRPNDGAFLVNFGLAILVGFASQSVLTRNENTARLSKPKAAVTLLCLCAGIGAALWIGDYFDHLKDVIRALSMAVPLLLLIGFFVVWGRAKLPFGVFAATLLLLTGADLIWRHSGAAFSARRAESIRAYQPAAIALSNEIRARLGNGKERGRVEILGLGGSWQNAAMVYQLEQTLGYDPVRLADYEQASGSDQNSHLNERRLTGRFTGYDSELAKSLGIRIVATGVPIETFMPASATRSLTLLGKYGEAYLYENAAVLPRVIVAPSSNAGEADESVGVAEIVSYRQSQVQIWAQMKQPGLLILHDLYHPAWTARIDGQPAPVLRAKGLFRAVALPAGEHHVTFTFEPLSWSSLRAAIARVRKAYGGG